MLRQYTRNFEPPYPYKSKLDNKPYILDNHYYAIIDNNRKRNSKSPWFSKKWLYNHTNENGTVEIKVTDNLIRHKMNSNRYKYGDIGITKIKNNIGDDLYKDTLLTKLIEKDIIPIIHYKPENVVNIGHKLISPDFASTRYSRNIEKYNKSLYSNKNFKILIWDTETTGIKDDDRIIQISLLDINNGTNFTKMFNPQPKEIHPKASEVTGITNEMLSNEPEFNYCIDDLSEFIKNDDGFTIMIAHNSIFDENKLKYEYFLANKKIPQNIIFADSLDMFRTWLSGNEYNTNEKTGLPLKGTFRLSSCSSDSSDILGLDLYTRFNGHLMENSHDALGDVIGLWDVFYKLFSKVWGRNEYWFICKKIIEFTFISEILDTPYINRLMFKISTNINE